MLAGIGSPGTIQEVSKQPCCRPQPTPPPARTATSLQGHPDLVRIGSDLHATLQAVLCIHNKFIGTSEFSAVVRKLGGTVSISICQKTAVLATAWSVCIQNLFLFKLLANECMFADHWLSIQVFRGYVGDRSSKPVWEGQVAFDVLGTGYQRPFELATLRLNHMVNILPRCKLKYGLFSAQSNSVSTCLEAYKQAFKC